MERPSSAWHEEICSKEVLDDLEQGVDKFEQACEYAKCFEEGFPGDTPEHIARSIGYMIYTSNETDEDISTPIESFECEEGMSLSLGYLGIIAMEEADM